MEDLSGLKNQITRVIVGKDQVIDLVLTVFLAGGHVLLEDMPGTGKTMLAKTLAKSLDADFSRIQFTPDLLPSDITGLHVYQPQTGDFLLKSGPIFAQIILADEINRATPRTQAALLECMEEHQVTLDGETLELKKPFFVIATQNPIESSGTFPLPEAQLDRFFMKISMGSLSEAEELSMIDRFENNTPFEELSAVLKSDKVENIKAQVRGVFVHPLIKKYIVDIVRETRGFPKVACGASPRSSLIFMSCAKAYAYIQGREYVVPEDIKFLASPILAHRLVLSAELRRNGGAENTIKQILKTIEVPTEDWRG